MFSSCLEAYTKLPELPSLAHQFCIALLFDVEQGSVHVFLLGRLGFGSVESLGWAWLL